MSRQPSGVPGACFLACAPTGDAVAVGGHEAVRVLRAGSAGTQSIPIAGVCHTVHWSSSGLRVLCVDDASASVVDAGGRTLWAGDVPGPGHLVAAFTPDGGALVTVDADIAQVIAWPLGVD
ncbi:hypothetical protein ACFOVU_28970 [Nocardiopsis sediminis]|uniref:WD40 repeat domain-containing protein n=1 Tax=Nocardiopsis sediminis TaxID=1778267 RepID=A0ABV8FXV3_9ACTN